VRPTFVFAENSPQLRTKGLATIVERFISMGYVGRVGVLGAGDIGANHERKRMWIVAVSKGQREWIGNAADTDSTPLRKQQRGRCGEEGKSSTEFGITDWWCLPRFAGVDDGMADRLERVKATGNGQVPGVAALVWSVLTSDLTAVNPDATV